MVPVISDWIVALEAADFCEPAEARHGPMILIDGMIFKPGKEDVLQLLGSTVTRHLGSQQMWYEFAQHGLGLRSLLMQLCASMHKAVKLLEEQSHEARLGMVHLGLGERFRILAAASRSCSTQSWQCQWLCVMLCHTSLPCLTLPSNVPYGWMGVRDHNGQRSDCLGKQNHNQCKPGFD